MEWSEKIHLKVSQFQKKLDDLFQDGFDFNESQIRKEKSRFQICEEAHLVNSLSRELPEDETERAFILFSKLHFFFEAGIFLSRSDFKSNNWKPEMGFLYGRYVHFPQAESMTLPPHGPAQVLRTKNISPWSQTKIYPFLKEGSMNCLLMQLSEEFTFALFTGMADPWLKVHTENIHQQILKAL